MNLKRLRRSVIAAVTAAAVVLAPVGAAVAAPAYPARGTVVSSVEVSHLTAEQVAALGLGAGHATHAITGYRLQYRTVGADGRPTTASGLVVLPDHVTGPLPVVTYEHGTRNNRHDVASVTAGTPDRDITETFASAGFLAVAPDYLGLGTGPGRHPYMDVRTEVSASLDLLSAATRFAGSHRATVDRTVRVTGFSQGGTAAMAVGEAMQGGALPGWRLVAVSPISGPYDVERTELPALVLHPGDGPGEVDPIEGVFYVAYWTVAQNRLHHFYRDPSEVFRAPYAGVLEGLFDGNHTDEEIVAALPGSARDLLTPSYVDRLRHPTGRLRDAVRGNDQTCQWRPRVPVHLYAASGDRDVPIGNAGACRTELAEHGVRVPLTDIGDVDHFGSAFGAVPMIVDDFATGISRRSRSGGGDRA